MLTRAVYHCTTHSQFTCVWKSFTTHGLRSVIQMVYARPNANTATGWIENPFDPDICERNSARLNDLTWAAYSNLRSSGSSKEGVMNLCAYDFDFYSICGYRWRRRPTYHKLTHQIFHRPTTSRSQFTCVSNFTRAERTQHTKQTHTHTTHHAA